MNDALNPPQTTIPKGVVKVLVCYDVPKKFEITYEKGTPRIRDYAKTMNYFNTTITSLFRDYIKLEEYAQLNKSVYLMPARRVTGLMVVKSKLKGILEKRIKESLIKAHLKTERTRWADRMRVIDIVLSNVDLKVIYAKDLEGDQK